MSSAAWSAPPPYRIVRAHCTTEELQRAPLTVTLGERSSDWFGSGVKKLAERAGTQAVIVPGKHFAYVTNPERMAEVVYTAAERAAR